MILVKNIKWLASKKLIAEVYGEDSNDLGTTIGDLTLSVGSKAYTGEGKSYVLSADGWVEVSAGGGSSTELPSSDNEEF